MLGPGAAFTISSTGTTSADTESISPGISQLHPEKLSSYNRCRVLHLDNSRHGRKRIVQSTRLYASPGGRLRLDRFGSSFHELSLELLVNSQNPPTFLKTETLLKQKLHTMPLNGSNKRRVSEIKRYDRIPAWPLKNGLPLQVLGSLPGFKKITSKLEETYGGRDCPNIFVNSNDISKTSPFLMLVHHNHSFQHNDPARQIEKSLIPEGFPSHAHRGMMTVTICIRGGLLHRDSLGIKQVFGADKKKYAGKHTQALNFGAGVVHELLWDNSHSKFDRRTIRQEMYQIWVDVPSNERLSNVSVDLIGDDESPIVLTRNGADLESRTTVIAGSHENRTSTMKQKSPFTILQVSVLPGKTWKHSSPTSFESMILYMRRGSAKIEGEDIQTHCTSFCTKHGDEIVVRAHEKEGADFLFLAGEPLNHKVVARGAIVMNSEHDVATAVRDNKSFRMGKPWSDGLTDEEWRRHVTRYPCQYESD